MTTTRKRVAALVLAAMMAVAGAFAANAAYAVQQSTAALSD